ncbi:acyl-CoA thioesterase domain-containing protein [Streptomyces sp. NPDC002677]|uniref:acyl-CoA thioesterase domain-containing protein n=1 Tax=Streptomyces sp. NPDC002677 TaxID=3154774 RepID=UPI00331BD675
MSRTATPRSVIDYVRPADGEFLRARAQVVRAGRALAVCRCELASVSGDGSETVCAVAQGTVSFAPAPGGDGA